MRKILTLAEFKQQAKGQDGPKLADAVSLRKVTPQVLRADGGEIDVKIEDGLIRVLNITSSDSSVDRERDTIRAAGWKLANFQRNPVILWSHNSRVPPVARALRTEILGEKLQQDFEFTPADLQHPMGMGFGHAVGRMFKEGFLNAVSVGFSPQLWQFNEERGGIDFLEQELLETSPVTIPANPNALADAGQRLLADGVDLTPVYEWAERCLEGDDGLTLLVPRKSIELTHKLLGKTLGKPERTFVDLGAAASAAGAGNEGDNETAGAEGGSKETPDATVPATNAADNGGADSPIVELAKTVAGGRQRVEADALKAINDAADAMEALGTAGDKTAFAEAFKRFAQLGLLTLESPPSKSDPEPAASDDNAERMVTIVADKAQIQISQKDLDKIFERVGKTTTETIAELTGRLAH